MMAEATLALAPTVRSSPRGAMASGRREAPPPLSSPPHPRRHRPRRPLPPRRRPPRALRARAFATRARSAPHTAVSAQLMRILHFFQSLNSLRVIVHLPLEAGGCKLSRGAAARRRGGAALARVRMPGAAARTRAPRARRERRTVRGTALCVDCEFGGGGKSRQGVWRAARRVGWARGCALWGECRLSGRRGARGPVTARCGGSIRGARASPSQERKEPEHGTHTEEASTRRSCAALAPPARSSGKPLPPSRGACGLRAAQTAAAAWGRRRRASHRRRRRRRRAPPEAPRRALSRRRRAEPPFPPSSPQRTATHLPAALKRAARTSASPAGKRT